MTERAPRGVIFDAQSYAIYDGPGIRTALYLKGCPLRCAWCHNPESQARTPEPLLRPEACDGRGACASACPEEAIALAARRPRVDPARCTGCGDCVTACTNSSLRLVGNEVGVEEVVAKLVADRPFYEASGGGVTITGGEPTWQPEFLVALLKRLKAERLHVTLETCGAFAPALIDALEPLVDVFYFDLKHVDPRAHKRGTGADNARILANFSELLRRCGAQRVTPRVPVIPGFNADPHAVGQLLAFLAGQGYAGEVHLMPYHRWARGKYEGLGRGAAFRDFDDVSPALLDELAAVVAARGMTAVRYGC